VSDAEIPIPKAIIAVLALIFGIVFLLSAFISYQILSTLEWVSWAGVMVCLGIFLAGVVFIIVGWFCWRVLRE